MPSPYGSKRSASTYYQHAGAQRHYTFNWDGLPPGPTHAGETRGLGDDGDSDYLDITATYHKSLGDSYPVAMSAEAARRSILHSGPEQTHIHDSLGIFGLSRNENRLLIVAGIGLAGYLAWNHLSKGKRK